MITHRCKGLLDAKCSIRYEFQKYRSREPQWYLSELVEDNEYDSKYLSTVAIINYCPFCGKKLEDI